MFTLTRNIWMGQRRRERVQRFHAAEHKAMASTASKPAQVDIVELKETFMLMGKLPASERQAMALLAVQQMSYEDAGAIAGFPVGTMKSRLSRGRKRLRRIDIAADLSA